MGRKIRLCPPIAPGLEKLQEKDDPNQNQTSQCQKPNEQGSVMEMEAGHAFNYDKDWVREAQIPNQKIASPPAIIHPWFGPPDEAT